MPRTVLRPGSAWDTGTAAPDRQIADRYLGATRADPALTPAVARQIITTYTTPGDTVCDPNPGPGLVLAEAIRTGRDAIGHVPASHCIALTAPIRGNRVRPRITSRVQYLPESTDLHGPPVAVSAHLDVLVFLLRKDTSCEEFSGRGAA
ncbi:site-specific DNA-methyltransferase [Saccharopolyspora gloriosae]|uniref:site-specific DNA-methyltransferase n=1 Tax=Saccharopolyspora gloriosae TaxID=455344 RepID=UPI001FB7444F|nr:site-specific DNA-methyltransferase [Saccharopolyspora gloriosae]